MNRNNMHNAHIIIIGIFSKQKIQTNRTISIKYI